MNRLRLEGLLRRYLHSAWFFPVSLATLVGAVFSPLFLNSAFVLSAPGQDIDLEFYYLRLFVGQELGRGHIPLWNPTLFSGNPCLGGWQSAPLYPPVWLHLLMPTAVAINLEVALHVFLTGLFMSWLARRFGFHPLACLTSGVALMLGGATFGHLYGGHLSILEAAAWVPLVLLAVDHLLEGAAVRWVLTGGLALAMMVLAGHPQTVFNTITIGGLYAVLGLSGQRSDPRGLIRATGGLLAAGGLGVMLSAAQWLPSVQCASEWSRALPSYAQSATFSFPPENWLTMLVPGLFGDGTQKFYWGRMYWWETTPYLGATFVPLMVFGASSSIAPRRTIWLALLCVCAVLMMGGFTPLFHAFYALMPGASNFRGYSKFEYQFCVFGCLLGAAGLDALIKRPRPPKYLSPLCAATALALAAASLWFLTSAGSGTIGWFHGFILTHGGEYYLVPNDADNLGQMAQSAARQLAVAALFFGLTAGVFVWTSRHRAAYAAVAALVIVEVAQFASAAASTYDSNTNRSPALTAWFGEHPGDYRILQRAMPVNSAAAFRQADVWGYDPLRLQRYFKLMAVAEHWRNAQSMTNPEITNYFPTLALFRCAYLVQPSPGGFTIETSPGALPHGLFVPSYRVMPGPDAAGAAVLDPNFRPRQTVILESDPDLAPSAPGGSGKVTVSAVNSDTMDVTTNCDAAGIVLITDPYSRFWRADSLDGSPGYAVMPGNYAEIAVPVGPGHHHFLLSYQPSLFRVGCFVSGFALLLGLGLFCLSVRKPDQQI